jgi:hypothetical protein
MITAANDTTITFGGHQQGLTYQYRSIEGSIDRVTGDVQATYTITNTKTDTMVGQFDFALQCMPTQRMFQCCLLGAASRRPGRSSRRAVLIPFDQMMADDRKRSLGIDGSRRQNERSSTRAN